MAMIWVSYPSGSVMEGPEPEELIKHVEQVCMLLVCIIIICMACTMCMYSELFAIETYGLEQLTVCR